MFVKICHTTQIVWFFCHPKYKILFLQIDEIFSKNKVPLPVNGFLRNFLSSVVLLPLFFVCSWLTAHLF